MTDQDYPNHKSRWYIPLQIYKVTTEQCYHFLFLVLWFRRSSTFVLCQHYLCRTVITKRFLKCFLFLTFYILHDELKRIFCQ